MILSTGVLRVCLIVAAVNLVVNCLCGRGSGHRLGLAIRRRVEGMMVEEVKSLKQDLDMERPPCPLLGSCSSIQSYRLEYHYQGKSKINRPSHLVE